jgi:hypothetical protein
MAAADDFRPARRQPVSHVKNKMKTRNTVQMFKNFCSEKKQNPFGNIAQKDISQNKK